MAVAHKAATIIKTEGRVGRACEAEDRPGEGAHTRAGGLRRNSVEHGHARVRAGDGARGAFRSGDAMNDGTGDGGEDGRDPCDARISGAELVAIEEVDGRAGDVEEL